MTACCGTSTTVHAGYAIKFSKCVYSCDAVDGKTLVSNSEIKLYCTQCKQNCLYCGKRHVLDNSTLSIIVCHECKKSWSYQINLDCKRKYDRKFSNPNPLVCVNWNVPQEYRGNILFNVVHLHWLIHLLYHLYHPRLRILIS